MTRLDFQPTLTGPTVIVRPISDDDWSELFAAGSDPEIWKVHPIPDRYTEPAFSKYFDSAPPKWPLCSSIGRPPD
jgi:hypothetical protein